MVMAATYQVSQPEPFDFVNLEDWPRFEWFRLASGLAEKSEEAQVNTLIYCMGDKADDSFKLSEEKYSGVKGKCRTLRQA